MAMAPDTATRDFESRATLPRPCNLYDFISDMSIIEEIERAAEDPDDPCIIFDWSITVVDEFIAKINNLPANATACPFLLPAPLNADTLRHSILLYIQSMAPGCGILGGIGGTAGLSCTQNQSAVCCANIGVIEIAEDWFIQVLETGQPLTGYMARIMSPQARVTTGICDPIPYRYNTMWE